MSFAQQPAPGTIESILDDRIKRANIPTETKPAEGDEKALNSSYTFQGRGNWSIDGLGSEVTPTGFLQAEVPPGSFVEQAFLYSATHSPNTPIPTVVFEGVTYSGGDWTLLGSIANNYVKAYRTDVTTHIRSLVGTGSASTFNFIVNSETPTANIDGEALVIVYSNPAEDSRQIIIYDGFASTSGDNTVINFPSAIPSVSSPNFEATLSLGIGFGYLGSTQFSEVDVNGTRLTSSAGSYDDGTPSNGGLITIGGIGDSRSNPADPFTNDNSGDDELYDIGGFLSDGDNSITLNTRNPSDDDIVFFMGVNIASEAFNPCDEGDIAGPSITCPNDVYTGCDAILGDYRDQATVTDNCDNNPTVTQSPMAGTPVGNGLTVTLTATDISGNSNTCTFWVGPEGECEDVPGAALRSNGGNQLVSVPDDPSLDLECAMTLEAWVNPSSYYIWGAIILKASGNSWVNGYGVYSRNGEVVFMPRGFSYQHFSGYTLPLDTWTHIACTYDGASSKIYINGSLVSTQAISGDIPQNNFNLGIGGDAGFTPFTFRGAIDEVRIWSQVLDMYDIQAGMNCEVQSASSCLVANYHFNQGIADADNSTVTTLFDASAYGNNGTLQGYALNGTSSNWVAPGGVTSGVACNASFSCDPDFVCCEGPEAICAQYNTVYIQPNGYATVTPADVDGGSTADCGLQSMTVSPNTFGCDDIGYQTVTLTVTDVNGETDQCTATVYIEEGDALPYGWDHDDVGGATGDAGFDPCEQKYFVESNGYTHPLSDKVHYAYQYLCGDMEITARVVSVDPHGFGGIMIRETLDGGSKKVALRTQLQPFVHRDVRSTYGGYQQTQQLFRPQHSWLRLKRIGNLFIGYTSTNGVQWQFAFFSNVQMNTCVKIGLFAEGPIDNTIARACFDNVTVTGGIQPNLVDNDGNSWETNTTRAVDFNVFPNPASDVVNINLTPFEDEVFTLRVFNNIGQEVYRKEYLYLEEYTERLDLSQYNNGIYMINIELEDGTILNKKFVVNRK
jgi:hypothetical protein